VGVGVTPSAWVIGGAASALQVKNASLYGDGASAITSSNCFFNASWKYIATAAASQYEQSTGAHKWYTAPSGTAGNAITFTQAMTLDASGNLLVGATSGSYRLVVTSGASDYTSRLQNTASSSPQGLSIYYSGAAPNGTGSPFLYCEDSGALRMSVRSNGGIANYSANDVNLSDRKEKTNFAPAKSYIDVICAIPIQTYNYIDQNLEEDDGLTLGVVAQDVQAVAPEFVMESNWGTEDEPKMRLSIYQTDLQYALMKCIQEQQALITSLTARLDAANL
jgi:hypothetical protein